MLARTRQTLKIVFLAPRNDLSGNRKLITKLAQELAGRHSVGIRYPIVPDGEFVRRLRHRPGAVARVRKLGGDCWRYLRRPRWAYAALLDSRVDVKPYVAALKPAVVADCDVVIYSTAYQALELARVPPTGSRRVYYVLHDQSRSEAEVVGDPEVIRQTYKEADHVVVLSRATERELAALGVKSEAVIPAGVDTAVFHPGDRDGASRPALLGYYWPGESRKGAGILSEAFRAIRRRHPDLEMNLLSPKGVRVEGFPTFGGLTETELAELYRRHDVFVFSSTQEGFGLPPLEAMASGCAVVATRVGAVEDCARNEHSALLCEPGNVEAIVDGLQRVIEDGELRRRLRTAAVKEAGSWSWRRAGESLERYLETVA